MVRCTVALQKEMVNVRLMREEKTKLRQQPNPLFRVKWFSRTQPLFDRTTDALDSTRVGNVVALCSEERWCPEPYILYIVLSTEYASGSVLIRM